MKLLYSSMSVLLLAVVSHVKTSQEDSPQSAGMLYYGWIFVIIACLFLLFILILICCICLFRYRGNKYDVDFKERKNGSNPEKELFDSGLHDHQKREVQQGSQNSLDSSARHSDDYERAVYERVFGEWFIPQYPHDPRPKIWRVATSNPQN